MRAVFSVLGLVVVMAVVLSLAKRQTPGMTAAAPAAPGASGASAVMPAPQAVGQQVQSALDAAARVQAEAAASATQ